MHGVIAEMERMYLSSQTNAISDVDRSHVRTQLNSLSAAAMEQVDKILVRSKTFRSSRYQSTLLI